MSDAPALYYLTPDHPEPSWGVGMLYGHVRLLRQAGFDARVLHHAAPFRLPWLDTEAPVLYADQPGFRPRAEDVVVVPEVLARSPIVAAHRWRRVVFVQGSFLILGDAPEAFSYPELGYQAAMAVLPHVSRIVERHFGLRAPVVPPFVAPYFFEQPPGPRRRRILLVAKEAYRIAGYPDAAIAAALLRRDLRAHPGWALDELAGLDHREVASRMQTSAFLVNLNCLEAFNTSVPEAMAAGCIPVCYEAVGGADYLRPGANAFVFPNNHVYALVEHLLGLVDRYDLEADRLDAMRKNARRTASAYRESGTASALEEFFADGLGIRR
jgi:glycosyltransferase involved in cell wall biosynthesis